VDHERGEPLRRRLGLIAVASLALLGSGVAHADQATPDSLGASADSLDAAADARAALAWTSPVERAGHPALEALVPELASDAYRMEPGTRRFLHRISVSPGYGFFGSDRLFTLRAAYNPNAWLGYEAAVSHDPGHAVHAVVHTLSAIVRRPFPGRLQPYLSGGYGMVIVYPGRALNAAPITKNTLAIGGGAELYIRSDLALRVDLREATVLGKQRDREGIVAYDYAQGTVGLAFYRSIQP
jgi:hypothetical protein